MTACRPRHGSRGDPASDSAASVIDAHSAARPHEAVVRHIGLQFVVDTATRTLTSVATLAIDRLVADAPLMLDTRALAIDRVQTARRTSDQFSLVDATADFIPAAYALAPADPILGQALRIELPAGHDLVRIEYRTTPEGTGLQWLDPPQTADARHPFLYSQSQAIHARSWFPCQDTPGVRITYDARIDAPPPLTALMAARATGPGRFEMPEPIPSYLVAIAVGAVQFAAIGDRSGVWAEPSRLEAATRELADVERMIGVAESLCGPYRWERYDVLFLPPAFPFGGMENPRLTFLTPTILAGDRSLVSLVAHELAHSWSGNLVTNATWDDLWLNEGFTVYIERRIVEALFGRERAEIEAMLGRQDLERALAELPDDDERLRVELAGRDPDDGLSDVAYEKGALLLRALEEAYGRDVFDPVLAAWFAEHAFTSVRTDAFERFIRARLLDVATPIAGRRPPDLRAWIDQPGMPGDAPAPRSPRLAEVDRDVAAFVAGTTRADALAGFGVHEWIHFLRALPRSLDTARLAELDAAFALTTTDNAEILAAWLELAIGAGYRAVDERLETFLRTVGRRKFLEPLYAALVAHDRRADAVRIYAAARPGYHAITRHTLDALLGSTP